MMRGYELLQKKLDELASKLQDVVALPVETPHHQLLSVSEVMNARFAFFKNLLSAEINSHPQGPQDLHQIVQRYEKLKSVFKDWYSSWNSSIDHLNTASKRSCTESGPDVVVVEDSGGSFPYHDDVSTHSCTESGPEVVVVVEDSGGSSPYHDIVSTHSCTESSLNNDVLLVKDGDGGGGGGSHDYDAHLYKDPPGILFKSVIQEEQAVATVKAEGYGHWERKREVSTLRLSGNKACAVMMSGVVMLSVAVAGVLMASFCGSCCYGSEMQGFLPPT